MKNHAPIPLIQSLPSISSIFLIKKELFGTMQRVHPKSSFPLNSGVFESLVIIFTLTFLSWYIQYHWKRRRLYEISWQRQGPLALPFIGSGLSFIGNTSDILANVRKIVDDFPSPVPVWLGTRLFFAMTGAKDLETILNSPYALAKEDLYKFAIPIVGTGLFTASVPKWKRHRKIIMPTFNQKILDDFVEVFAEQSEILVEQLKKQSGKKPFDIFHYVSRCTLDIICETAMGMKVHAQTTEADYVKWANKAMEIVFKRMFNVWYHSDFIFNRSPMGKELDYLAEKMKAFTRAVVKEKREAYQRTVRENKQLPEGIATEEPRKRTTFLQQLIELSEEGAKFTDEELREEVDTFMIAGSDTTASMNSFTFIMLGMHPDIQEKVYEEVMEVLGPDRPVECKDLGKFTYLERVIKETLRIFPVGPLLVRAVSKDIQLEHCVIPAGSSVVMAMITLHRDPELWPDPLRFDPDRFLPEEVAKRHPYSYLPFSGGPRNCVGPKYASMAMKALIATVIRKYRVYTDYNSVEEIKLKADLMLKPVDGYRVGMELRE